VKIILDSRNDYLIEAKGNQPKLLEQLKDIVADNTLLNTCLTQEKNRGRKENRYHEIYDALEGIPECWEGVKSVIYVHRYGHRPDKKRTRVIIQNIITTSQAVHSRMQKK